MKHLRVLRRAGAIDVRTDSDRRLRLYFLPPGIGRDTPEGERILDYPHCLIRPGLTVPPPAPAAPVPDKSPPEPDDDMYFRIMP